VANRRAKHPPTEHLSIKPCIKDPLRRCVKAAGHHRANRLFGPHKLLSNELTESSASIPRRTAESRGSRVFRARSPLHRITSAEPNPAAIHIADTRWLFIKLNCVNWLKLIPHPIGSREFRRSSALNGP